MVRAIEVRLFAFKATWRVASSAQGLDEAARVAALVDANGDAPAWQTRDETRRGITFAVVDSCVASSAVPHGIDRRIPWVVGMPLRLKPFCPVPRPQQGDIDREMLGRQQAAATRLRDDVFKERARDVPLQQPIPIVREPQRLRVRVRHPHWRQIARAITSSQLQCVTPIRLHAIARLHAAPR